MQELLQQAENLRRGVIAQLETFDKLAKQLPAPLRRELRTLMEQAKQGTLNTEALQRIAKMNNVSIDAEIKAAESSKATTKQNISTITNMLPNEPTGNQS